MRLAGLLVPDAKEMIDLSYEFDEDFIIDDSAYTALEEGLTRTVKWYQDQAG